MTVLYELNSLSVSVICMKKLLYCLLALFVKRRRDPIFQKRSTRNQTYGMGFTYEKLASYTLFRQYVTQKAIC